MCVHGNNATRYGNARITRARRGLKKYNASNHTFQFIREDLTRARSQLAYEARKLKRTGVIKDTWVFDGKIFLKQLNDNTTVCSDIASLPCRAVDDN